LKKRKQFYQLYPQYTEEADTWKKIEEIFKLFQWLLTVGSAHAPNSTLIELFEEKALKFLNLLKTNFFSQQDFKDYEHLLVKHVPTILQKYQSLGKFSLQSFEHKNKLTKRDYQKSTSKGGGLSEISRDVNIQLINHDVSWYLQQQ